MTSILSQVQSGRRRTPIRAIVHGPSGVGKTTLGAALPRPLVIGAEDGTAALDVPRIAPASWGDLFGLLGELYSAEHGYASVVVDSLDWLEPVCWRAVCERGKKSSIEEFGYGKGYIAALDEWRALLQRFEALLARGIHVCLIAHSKVRQAHEPGVSDSWDRYEMKLHQTAGALLTEWCDHVLFANHETLVDAGENRRAVGVSTGKRYLHTQPTAAYAAKARWPIAPRIEYPSADRAASVWIEVLASKAAGMPVDRDELARELAEIARPEPLAKALAEAQDGAALTRVAERIHYARALSAH